LPFTTWFQAFYLIGEAKTGISSLDLSRHLGMTELEDAYVLRGKTQLIMSTSGENSLVASQARDQSTKSQSSEPFLLTRLVARFTPKQRLYLASVPKPESLRVVEIPWGLSPGYAGAELTTAQGSGA